MLDYVSISTNRVNTLDSRLVSSAHKILTSCWRDHLPVYVIWAYRTTLEQDLLYRYGRTAPGKMLTQHRAGFSAHNYGRALDFCLVHRNKLVDWQEVYPDREWRHKWIKVIKRFEAEGWEAGWRWPTYEPGHVQNMLGETIHQLSNV